MGFGGYGHYIEAQGNGGINLGHVAFEAGYRAVNMDIHVTSNGGSGVVARLNGPIFSLVFRF